MAAAAYSARAYQSTAVDTSDRNHQVVLLFEAAVRFLTRAQEAMARRDYEGQCNDIVRTQKILCTLIGAVDVGVDPDAGQHLLTLYNWLHANLTEASLRDDTNLLAEITQIMADVRDAWRQAEQNLRTEQPDALPQDRAA